MGQRVGKVMVSQGLMTGILRRMKVFKVFLFCGRGLVLLI